MSDSYFTIPERFGDKLQEDAALAGCIKTADQRFGPWMTASGTPFFPEYTDHGPRHLSRVLAICEWCVADESWAVLTPSDVTCLVLSVLLHDSAMHLTPDSFRALLATDDKQVRCPALDRGSWQQLWQNYLLETKHWDQRKWMLIVGDDYEKRVAPTIGEPYELDLNKISEGEFPIVGEFIRRHHPRLAHEFALAGVPSPAQSEPLLLDPPPGQDEFLDLAGLVARSHGSDLRASYRYLDDFFYGRAEVLSAHPLFLMGILRIADFLDLYSERASSELLKVKKIRSGLSRREWEAHQSIREIRYDAHSDPETVQIIARPTTALAYQRVLQWTNGIQRELDHSWAVLGENVGRHSRLGNLKLRLRRITTPLSRPDFATTHRLDFHPELCRFDVDPGNVLRLLIKPLYGNQPEVAVRELLQNALDAVRELDVYRSCHNLDRDRGDDELKNR